MEIIVAYIEFSYILSPLIFNPGQSKDVYPCFILGEMGVAINEVTEPVSIEVEPVPIAIVFIHKTTLPHCPGTHLGSQPLACKESLINKC